MDVFCFHVDADSHLDVDFPSMDDLYGSLGNFCKSDLHSAQVKHLWLHGLIPAMWARNVAYGDRCKTFHLFGTTHNVKTTRLQKKVMFYF